MIKVNEKSFFKIFGLIFKAYQGKKGIFGKNDKKVIIPQNTFWPRTIIKGSKDHLYWLALVAFSDKRTDSVWLYMNFAKMFERNPSLFERGYYPSLGRMAELFKTYGIALPTKEIAFFIERKHHLDEFFQGDPVKIYEGSPNVESLIKNLKNIGKQNEIKNLFPGAKEKIFCLLAMFLREYVDLKFEDIVPIDAWVQAISASTGVLEGKGYIKFSNLGKLLRPLMAKAFLKHRSIYLAENATWILGKTGCTHCSWEDMSKLCPVYNLCKGPFKSTRHAVSGKHLAVIQLPLKHLPKFVEK